MFVKKTQIGVGNLLQLILNQTVLFAIESDLLKHFCEESTLIIDKNCFTNNINSQIYNAAGITN